VLFSFKVISIGNYKPHTTHLAVVEAPLKLLLLVCVAVWPSLYASGNKFKVSVAGFYGNKFKVSVAVFYSFTTGLMYNRCPVVLMNHDDGKFKKSSSYYVALRKLNGACCGT
jgi:hypothetical protein